MAITDKVYLENHRQIAAQLDTSVPRRAFAGATLDIFFQEAGLTELDDSTRDRMENFAADFLEGCDESGLHTGVPERRFIEFLLECRAEGMNPDTIVDTMSAEYGLTAYPGDVRSFLDDSIRTLEAASQLAGVDGQAEANSALQARRDELL
jgi:superfamily II helicase